MPALRSLAALLVVVVLLGGLALGVEWFARGQVEAVVTDVVRRELAQVSDPGQGFQGVEASVAGSALLGLARGRFEAVTVTTGPGTVQGVPVRALDVRADGVSTDGATARALTATVRVEAAGALQAQLDAGVGDAPAGTVLTSTTAVPPDRLLLQAPFEVPVLGPVPVEVELLLRVDGGRLLVEPVQARAAGLDLDLADAGLGGLGAVDEQLPEGIDVAGVQVVDEAGTAVVVADLACAGGCPFGR